MTSSGKTLRQVGVVDIGSNSVRLVIYDIFGCHFTPVYNEKILAGLGRDLKLTGKLSATGRVTTLAALARFSQIARARQLPPLLIGATAALRVAEDAPDFVAQVMRDTGLDISPISGEEEARLSAIGLLSSNDRRQGLAADLGGASLELVNVTPELRETGTQVQGVSLPLGPFDAIGGDLSALTTDDYAAQIPKLDDALSQLPNFLMQGEVLYLIGGAWRNLASIHQHRTDYPLRTLQGYGLEPAEAASLAKWAWTEGLDEVLNWSGMRSARAETLPYSGVLLGRLLERFKPRRVVISMAGLREGLVWNHLPEGVKSRDALIDGCRDFARGSVQAEHFGVPLFRFLAPILPHVKTRFGAESASRLIHGACHLAGLGKNLHPDHRAELVFEDVIYAPVSGLTHSERAFMSLSLFRTYSAKRQPPIFGLLEHLLDEAEQNSAALVGETIRLAIVATGRTPALLADFSLLAEAGKLTLRADLHRAAMVTDQVNYRLAKLAKLMGLEPQF